ncbi:conserved hypothetical protein [Methylocella tundrae]|uniref:Uncharacterized protein n=1 Tax=Methylocella tundrae TaxID=227605 RepID=A0A8B6M3U7_METTU|nr:hypothetical protein [Methylocella tundrae]VTZ48802.1 conserved hypothetical protein [Methylocella tundrae]
MKKTQLLASTAAGAILGALVFGSGPAVSQMAVVDWPSIAIQQAVQAIQNTISSTLTSMSGILGDVTNGSITTLLVQGFTQNANYSKAQIDAVQQIADAHLLASTRVNRDFRNAQIRDEHTVNSNHCAAIDNGQTITVGAGQSYVVANSIENVADPRGEAEPNTPAYLGQAQAVAAISQLHLSRYCSQAEASAGLCTLSQTPNADQRATSLFGPGTLNGQAGVNAANDFVTNLTQPIVPAALRGEQLTSEIGRDAMARRHEYNARMSLARSVLDYAIGVQAPSVPLTAAQQQQMTNEGLTPLTTGSWLQAIMLDSNRRYSDLNWAAQLQAMPPASVEREIAQELAATNYLLTQLYRVNLMNASANGAHLAATTEHIYQPTVELPTPNMSN